MAALPEHGLSPRTLRCIDILFPPEERERAQDVLLSIPEFRGAGSERCRLAALKISDGNLARLERAAKLARHDFRDLLMAAGFGGSAAHLEWTPKPAGEPSEIDPGRLSEGIHARIGEILGPIGLRRQKDEWNRIGEVRQSLRLIQGLTSRVEVRFFLRLKLETVPLGVMLQLPRLPNGPAGFTAEQGYIFRSGGSPSTLSEQAFYDAVTADVTRYAKPWFERFTSAEEVQRGFEDGTLRPHLRLTDQPVALMF